MGNSLKAGIVVLATMGVLFLAAQTSVSKSSTGNFEYVQLVSNTEWSFDGTNSVTSNWLETKTSGGASVYPDDRTAISKLSIMDGVNYLGNKGWEMVSAFDIDYTNEKSKVYVFKRSK